MAAYRQVYDSRHLQADCKELGSAPEPYTLGNQMWAAFIMALNLTTLESCRPFDAHLWVRQFLNTVKKVSKRKCLYVFSL